MKTHLQGEGDKTVCGRNVPEGWRTQLLKEVDCGVCLAQQIWIEDRIKKEYHSRAFQQIREQYPDFKVIFQEIKHPADGKTPAKALIFE